MNDMPTASAATAAIAHPSLRIRGDARNRQPADQAATAKELGPEAADEDHCPAQTERPVRQMHPADLLVLTRSTRCIRLRRP